MLSLTKGSLRNFALSHYAVPGLLTIFALMMATRSTGFFELDELAHFMKSRDSWNNWHNLLDIWGRPLCTFLFAAAAPFGIAASRCLAVAITCLTAFGTVRLASLLEDQRTFHPELIWLLLFAQPMFLLQSFAVMTEMMLACLWVWALVLLSMRKPAVAGLLVGLGGLARPEGWVAILCWPFFLRAAGALEQQESAPGKDGETIAGGTRDFGWKMRALIISIVLSVLPSFLWALAGWMAYDDALWFVKHWPWAPRSPYGRTPLKFLLSLLVASAFWMTVPVVLGIRDLMQRSRTSVRARRAILFVAGPFLAVGVLHATLGTLGLFGSLSLPRYFVVVAPMMAVLSAHGLYTVRMNTRRWSLIVVLSLAPMLLLLLARQLPIPTNAQFRRVAEAAAWAQRQAATTGVDLANIVAAHPYVYYRLDLPLDSEGHRRVLTAGGLETAPSGTIVITENVIWEFDGFPGQPQLEAWGYRLVKSWSDSGKEKRSLPRLSSFMDPHLVSLVGDTARVHVWVKE